MSRAPAAANPKPTRCDCDCGCGCDCDCDCDCAPTRQGFAPYVDTYAKDAGTFYADFAAAFQKLEELGTSGLVAVDV